MKNECECEKPFVANYFLSFFCYSGGGIHHTVGSEAQNKLGSYGQTFGVINQSSMDVSIESQKENYF